MTASKNEPLSVISRLDALIEQALHLAKAPPFTDKMVKNGRLSVKFQTFRTRFYGQMVQKSGFVRKFSS